MGDAMLERPEIQEFFQLEPLVQAGRKLHDEYVSAKPFPHIVLDGFFPRAIIEEIAASLRPPDEHWIQRDRPEAFKRGCPDETQFDPRIQAFLYKLQSAAFLRFLEALTGIEPLLPDPHFHGGGIHQSPRGGFLDIHADFNVHKELGLERRMNLILFLNKDWKEEWGGHAELWDAEMEKREAKVLPVLNRCLIFSTSDVSFHGHPHPLTCPEGEHRKSIALYYYTVRRPEEERSAPHSTLYQKPGVLPEPPKPARPSLLGRVRSWLGG
jgi:Rps23 Pro-64 3,4-dihydroxylase Tpa1-like proline 4-hydroxylase